MYILIDYGDASFWCTCSRNEVTSEPLSLVQVFFECPGIIAPLLDC